MLSLLLLVRILNPVGQGNYIPFYTEKKDHDDALKNNSRSIMIYERGRYILDFVDFSVYRFSGKIAFACALEQFAPSSCTQFPCFVGYEGERALPLEQPLWTLARFAMWCGKVLSGENHVIRNDVELRDVLRKQEEFVMGVGNGVERPKGVEKFVRVAPKVLEKLKLNISNGVWLYRPRDRSFVPYEGGARDVPFVQNLTSVNESEKFVAGCVLSKSDEKPSQKFLDVLWSLNKKWGDKFDYVLTNDEEWKPHAKYFNLSKLTAPYFFIVKFEEKKPRRFFVRGDDGCNWSYVDAFVERVYSGKEEPRNISAVFTEEGPEVKFRQVGSADLEKRLISKDRVSLLALTASWCAHCKHFKPVLNVTAEFLAERYPNIDFFWIDGPKNDLPAIVPDFAGYPTVFMWPAGEAYERPVSIEGGRTFAQLLTWIRDKSGLQNFTIPEYDKHEMKARIKKATKQQA